MKDLIRKLIVAMAIILSPEIATASSELAPLTYTEPISGTEFEFKMASIDKESEYDYKKAEIETPASFIYIYSNQNPDNKQYKWSKLNEFDSNNYYGNLTGKEKLVNADGWIRYYDGAGTKNEKLKYCIILVRGNAYALYVVEGAYDTTDFVMPDIVKKTMFGKIEGIRIENDGSYGKTFWMLTGILATLTLLSSLIVKDRKKGSFIIYALALVCSYGLLLYFWLGYNWLTTLGIWFIAVIIWYAIIEADSWSDFFKIIDRIISKAGD